MSIDYLTKEMVVVLWSAYMLFSPMIQFQIPLIEIKQRSGLTNF